MPALADVQELKSIFDLAGYYIDEIREKYPNGLVFDLACGKKKLPIGGARGVDLYADADFKCDLVKDDWDFTPDDSVAMFYCSHFLEHVSDINAFMDKAYHKLKDGGYFLITTPYGWSPRAWQDPDHKRPIFRETYWYFNRECRKNMGVDHYEGRCNFDIVQMWPVWNAKYATRAENNESLREQYMNTIGAVDDLTVLLRKGVP